MKWLLILLFALQVSAEKELPIPRLPIANIMTGSREYAYFGDPLKVEYVEIKTGYLYRYHFDNGREVRIEHDKEKKQLYVYHGPFRVKIYNHFLFTWKFDSEIKKDLVVVYSKPKVQNLEYLPEIL